MGPETALAFVFLFVISGGVLIVISGMRHRARILEMEHRERLALIERGLKPADVPLTPYDPPRRPMRRSSRLLSGGIVTIGFGLGLAFLIAFASREPEVGIGIGGAIVVLGASFVVTALVTDRGMPVDDFAGRSPLTREGPPPRDREP